MPFTASDPMAPRITSGRPTAIVCSAQHWHAAVHLSAHHLAKFLVGRGFDVCFLSTPTSWLHRLRFASDTQTRQRFSDWWQDGGTDLDGHLYYYTPMALVPPSRLAGFDGDWLMRNWIGLSWPRLPSFLATKGFGRPDLMVLDSALMLPLWQKLERPRLIYRVTDRNRDFPNQPSALSTMERELASAADLVVYTGSALADYVAGLQPRQALCIPNGVESGHFADFHAEPDEYKSIPAPRAVFVGTIAEWFDESLVVQAAHACRNVSFVIIGPGSGRLTRLSSLVNVHLLGPRPYACIPAYLQHAALGLIPFRSTSERAFVDNINPLKLYEYMAAGLPVVSTAFQQIEELASPAHIAAHPDAFISAVQRCATTASNGYAERAFASRFDWTHQFAPLAKRLGI